VGRATVGSPFTVAPGVESPSRAATCSGAGVTSNAARLASSWSSRRAPMIGEETPGWHRTAAQTQQRATAAAGHLSAGHRS
jgi:hypothetical protein